MLINLRVMFAFRCLFLSENKTCTLHPSVIGGSDIRPEHCGYLGSLDAKPNEKGYCRIIHTAAGFNISPPLTGGDKGEGDRFLSDELSKIKSAIAMEREVSEKFYEEGYTSAETAAEALVENIKGYVEKNAPYLLPDLPHKTAKSPGRNDPCDCGSGKKYKKCHGL